MLFSMNGTLPGRETNRVAPQSVTPHGEDDEDANEGGDERSTLKRV